MRGKLSNVLIRAGVAFAFLYPPFDALSNPNSWIGYFPHSVRLFTKGHGVPDLVLLHSFGALEAVIALWILSGKKIFLPSLAATCVLLAIVVLDFQDFEVVFRDVAIAAAAAALAVDARRRIK